MAVKISPFEQVRLLAGVRWQVFRNNLRAKHKKVGLIWDTLTYVVLGLIQLGTSFGFVMMGYFAGKQGKTTLLLITFWVIFAIWQLVPVMVEGSSPGLNFAEIVRYPISFNLYFFLASIYGFVDIIAIACNGWLLAIWLGLLTANSNMAFQAVPSFLLFLLLNLFLNRWAFAFLERVLSTRKGRERMLVFIFAFSFTMQIFGNVIAPRMGKWLQENKDSFGWLIPYVKQVLPFLSWIIPPHIAQHGIMGPLTERLSAWAILVVMILFCIWRYRKKLWLTYSGEIYSESNRASGTTDRRLGWKLPLVSGRISAIVQKELLYIKGQPQMIYNMAVPLFLGLVTIFRAPIQNQKVGFFNFSSTGSAGSHMFLTYFCVFIMSGFSYNMLGMDSTGYLRWLLAPVRMREVLIGKTLTAALLMCIDFVLISALVIYVKGFDSWGTPAVIVAFFALMLYMLGLSNVLSVVWPKKVAEFTLKRKPVDQKSVGVAFLMQFLIVGFMFLVSFIGRWTNRPWLPLAVAIFFLPLTAFLYYLSLNFAERRIERKSEELLLELT